MPAIDVRQDLRILVLFLIVQFAGLLLATQLYYGVPVVQIRVSQASAAASVNTAAYYIVSILVFTAILLLLIRRMKSDKMFIILEAFAVFYAAFIVFLIVIGAATGTLQQLIYSGAITYQYFVAAVLALALVLAKRKWPSLRNTASVIASVGIGVIVGVYLDLFTIFIFMVLLAIYDYVAVFITKHMVTMGQAAVRMNLAFLVGTSEVEALPAGQATRAQIENYKKNKKFLGRYSGIFSELGKRSMVPVIGQRILGNGDLAVPLMASVSAYKVFQNFTFSLVIVLGATAGLVVTFFILQRYRRALPAIPPLLAGITIFSIAYLAVTGSAGNL